jgi:hypothetical protein
MGFVKNIPLCQAPANVIDRGIDCESLCTIMLSPRRLSVAPQRLEESTKRVCELTYNRHGSHGLIFSKVPAHS